MNDNESQINDLKEVLRDVMMLIAERGKPLSEDLKLLLTQVMEHVANRIQQLRNQENLPVQPIQLEKAQHPSAQINAFNYDPKSKQLHVKFQGDYPQENGPQYVYDNVPENIAKLFMRGAVAPKTSGRNPWHEWKKGMAPSLGASMNALIKMGGYKYQKVA